MLSVIMLSVTYAVIMLMSQISPFKPFMLNVNMLNVIMVNVIMLNVIMLSAANKPFMKSVIMLTVIMLSVIMQRVIMLSVMAPYTCLSRGQAFLKVTFGVDDWNEAPRHSVNLLSHLPTMGKVR